MNTHSYSKVCKKTTRKYACETLLPIIALYAFLIKGNLSGIISRIPGYLPSFKVLALEVYESLVIKVCITE